MTIAWRKISALSIVFAAFIWSSVCNAEISLTEVSLSIDAITNTQSAATSDNTYTHGWKWNIDVTVPDTEAALRVKFTDWSNDDNTIDPYGNTRFYSAESLNAPDEAHAIGSAESDYGEIMFISTSTLDRDPDTLGVQVRIVAEMKIPSGTKAGSYSGHVYVDSEPVPSISFTEQPVAGSIDLAYGTNVKWSTQYFSPKDVVTVELWDTRSQCSLGDQTCAYAGWSIAGTTTNSGEYPWQADLDGRIGYYGTTSDKVYRLHLVAKGDPDTDSNAYADVWSEPFAINDVPISLDNGTISNPSPKPGDIFTAFGTGFTATGNKMNFYCPDTDPTMEYSIDNLASPNGKYFDFIFPTYPNYTTNSATTTTPCFLTVSNMNGTTSPAALIYLTIDSSIASSTVHIITGADATTTDDTIIETP